MDGANRVFRRVISQRTFHRLATQPRRGWPMS
jgi:hypothetical protein